MRIQAIAALLVSAALTGCGEDPEPGEAGWGAAGGTGGGQASGTDEDLDATDGAAGLDPSGPGTSGQLDP